MPYAQNDLFDNVVGVILGLMGHIRRREFITLVGSVAAWRFAARAAAGDSVVWLLNQFPAAFAHMVAAFHLSLNQVGILMHCSSCQTARRFQDSAIWSKLLKCVPISGTSPTVCTTLCVIR